MCEKWVFLSGISFINGLVMTSICLSCQTLVLVFAGGGSSCTSHDIHYWGKGSTHSALTLLLWQLFKVCFFGKKKILVPLKKADH